MVVAAKNNPVRLLTSMKVPNPVMLMTPRLFSLFFSLFFGITLLAPAMADALERVELQEFTRDRVVFDTGAARGENTVSVPLTVGSADAPDGSEVEVRFVRADTGQEVHPWRTIGVLSDGALTGRYVQPSDARSVHWLRPQARVKGSAAVDEASNTCGFGHVWNMWGQSNWAQLWGNYNSNLAGLFEPQVTNPGDVQCLEYARVRNAISRGNPVPDPVAVTQGNLAVNGGSITPSVLDFANALQAVRPGEKFMLGAFFNGGQGFNSALSDGKPWEWAHNQATVDKLTENGETVGVVWCMGWTASNWGGNVAEKTTRAFLGKNLDGTPFTTKGRGFSANTTHGDDQGGLYDWTVTRFGYAGPHGRGSRNRTSPLSVHTVDDLADYDSDDSAVYQGIVDNLQRVSRNPEPFPEMLPYVGQTAGGERGNGLVSRNHDSAHHRANSKEGRQRLARIAVHNMMQSLGWMSSPLPRFNRRYDEPSGAWADFWIEGNNTLGTLRGVLGAVPGEHAATIASLKDQGATLAPEQDHRTQVMGWSINRQFAQRAQIHTVTPEEVAAGHPAPVGQVVNRVWPRSDQPEGFAWHDQIIYGVDMWPGYLASTDNGSFVSAKVTPDWYGQRAFLNWAVVDMGQPEAVIDHLPVQFQGTTYTLPSTLSAPPRFAVPDRVVLRTPAKGSGLAAADRVVIELEGKLDDISGGQGLMYTSGGKFFIDVTSYGRLRIRNDQDIVDLHGFVCPGQWFYLKAVIEPASDGAGVFKVFDRDGDLLAQIPPGDLVRNDFFVLSKDELVVNAFTSAGSWVRWNLWVDQPDTNGPPTWGIEGDAAAPHYRLHGFTEQDFEEANRPVGVPDPAEAEPIAAPAAR